MVTIPVQCPHCHSTEVIKAGKQATGAQRASSVKIGSARGGSFSSSIRIGAGCLRSAARWWTWLPMAAGSTIPPACCGAVPRP
jgi:hypothetical protein